MATGGFFQRFGKPGKAGKAQRPEQVDAGRGGAFTGGNAIPGPVVAYGRQPIPTLQAQRLFVATSLTSPMVCGRFRTQGDAAATSRGVDGGSPDLGTLQVFRGLFAGPMGVRLGAQAGPSSQPGYPSTNNDPSTMGLSMMDLPDLIRVRAG